MALLFLDGRFSEHHGALAAAVSSPQASVFCLRAGNSSSTSRSTGFCTRSTSGWYLQQCVSTRVVRAMPGPASRCLSPPQRALSRPSVPCPWMKHIDFLDAIRISVRIYPPRKRMLPSRARRRSFASSARRQHLEPPPDLDAPPPDSGGSYNMPTTDTSTKTPQVSFARCA